MVDDPTYDMAMNYFLFDSEGMTQKPITLFENGVYKSVYHNSKTSSELKTENNFSASRGARGSLSTSSTNMIITSSSSISEDELLYTTPVVEIFSIQGAHSGADAISGNFSFGASGILKEGNKETPIKGFTISGNFYSMMNSIHSFGDKVHSDSGKSFFSPLIKFNKLHLSGS